MENKNNKNNKKKNNKKKNNISLLKKIQLGIEGFLTMVAALFSTTVLELTTGVGEPQEIQEAMIEKEKAIDDIFENNESLLILAKKIVAYEYNKDKNEDEKISTEDIDKVIKIRIINGSSTENSCGVDFKKDEQGNKYALIVSSEGSEYGGYGSYLEIIINDEIYRGAKQNEFDNPNPAYYENELIDAEIIENDKNNFMLKGKGEVFNIAANLVTAYKNEKNGRGEIKKYKQNGRKYLEKYIKENGEVIDYLMKKADGSITNDAESSKNHQNNGFKASIMPATTHEATYEELGEQVLGEDSELKVVFPEDINGDKQNNDER